MIWDNSPAHRGDAIRAYLTTPNLNHRREEVKRRCRTLLQAKADELIGDTQANLSALQMWISPWFQFRFVYIGSML